jgi:hypothetical protein
MKSVTFIRTSLGLLFAAGACVPLSALADEEYVLWHSQMSTKAGSLQTQQRADLGAQPGAQGAIRTEAMDLDRSHGEDALYYNIAKLQQSSSGRASARPGAQGPIRTEDVWEVNRAYGEDALYYNIARLHQ